MTLGPMGTKTLVFVAHVYFYSKGFVCFITVALLGVPLPFPLSQPTPEHFEINYFSFKQKHLYILSTVVNTLSLLTIVQLASNLNSTAAASASNSA